MTRTHFDSVAKHLALFWKHVLMYSVEQGAFKSKHLVCNESGLIV